MVVVVVVVLVLVLVACGLRGGGFVGEVKAGPRDSISFSLNY